MKTESLDLSIIVPVYNEADNLPELYQRVKMTLQKLGLNYELILVNDGSADASQQLIESLAVDDPRVFYIQFSRNFGHQIAVSAGLDYAQGKSVVIIDADLQDPPELIADLYHKHQEGFEVVYARRIRRKGDGWLKRFTAAIFYRLLNKLTKVSIPLDTGDFRIMDRKVVEYLKKMPEQQKFLRGQIAWVGFRQSEVLFEREERRFGKTGYSWSKMIQLALDGITGFSDKPLRWVTQLGLLISFFSFLIILYALFSHFILHQTITGWTSLIISSMFTGGIQLICLGIMGEYISRIHRNVQNRPLYVIDRSNCSIHASRNHSQS